MEDQSMITSFLTLRVRSRRDVLVARQRARQIAGLLRFSPRRQHVIAAAAFEIAFGLTRRPGGGTLQFELQGDAFHVFTPDLPARMPGLQRLVQLLPDPAQTPAAEDLPWLVEQLMWYTPLNVFEEIRHQNRVVLDALQELEAREAATNHGSQERHNPAA
jgi:hypothetical protein